MALTRITITLAPALLRAADRRARELGRSRSWVLAEALRLSLGGAWGGARTVRDAEGRGGGVRERAPAYESAALDKLGAYRREQLEADLALTPEQRVREAEETLRVAQVTGSPSLGHRLLFFDRYEDYLEWERREDLAPR